MSFQISKNKMSFAADDLCTSRKLSNTAEQVVGKGTSHVLDTITYAASDSVHHVQFQFRAYFPSTTSAQLPEKFSIRINDSLTEQCVTTLRDYYVLGSLHASCTDPIVKLEFSVTASAASNFTMPAGSCIHYGASPNEAVPTAASIPAPPAVSSRFDGLPHTLDAAVIHPETPDVLMGFKGDVIYYQSISGESEHAANGSIAATFPEFTGTVRYVNRSGLRGVNSDGHNIYWQIYIYNTNMDYFRYEYTSGTFTFMATGNHSWKDYTASGYDWQLNFKEEGSVQKVDALGNTGNFQPYGPGTSLYPTLPNTSPVTAVVNDQVNSRVIALIGDTMYSLTGSPSNSVTEHWVYG
jgi:hypothetical protein